jgi:hypothetical protein
LTTGETPEPGRDDSREGSLRGTSKGEKESPTGQAFPPGISGKPPI